MTITERTLRQWRKDALRDIKGTHSAMSNDPSSVNVMDSLRMELNKRILRLTQELLDQYLMKGK